MQEPRERRWDSTALWALHDRAAGSADCVQTRVRPHHKRSIYETRDEIRTPSPGPRAAACKASPCLASYGYPGNMCRGRGSDIEGPGGEAQGQQPGLKCHRNAYGWSRREQGSVALVLDAEFPRLTQTAVV
jgi:hypothetical protein